MVHVGREQHSEVTRRPQALAARLAAFARRLYTLTLMDLAGTGSARLVALYCQAQVEISPALSRADFADLLAQVLVYTSLLVRYSSQERQEPFARALYTFLSLPALPPFVYHLLTTLLADTDELAPAPDLLESAVQQLEASSANELDTLATCMHELTSFLIATDIQALLERLRPACLQSDPLVYFYEIFLTAYAPQQRNQRGVYYTPTPAIAYIVRAIDELLRDTFAYPAGLSGALQDGRQDGGVFLCDPACGMGAFLWAVLDHVRHTSQETARNNDALHNMLPRVQERLAGYEVMPAAYILACIELAMRQATLEPSANQQGHAPDPPLGLTLANVLADAQPLERFATFTLPVILGNPPYAGHSLNHSAWLAGLLESYKIGDASLKKPAQTKWLSDDYVQFLRLAQWRIEQAGRGILAFLTSHSYLDNPTFRGMRLSLLRSFNEIYILDLHGNSKRREQAPNGARDHNIFPIQQGVAIGIFVKRGDSQALATVHHADIWGLKAVYAADEDGTRQLSGGKLGWLASHNLSNTPWRISRPTAPFYLFTPRRDSYQSEYMANWSLPAIFSLNGDPAPGIVTCQDDFAISWNAAESAAKVTALLATSEEAQARKLFRLCAQKQWNYAQARRELSTDAWRDELGRIAYRPFDTRWTIFERHVAVHLRARVTRHMRTGPNLALVVGRAGQVIDIGDTWDIAFCTRLPTEFNLYRRGGNYLFPLYLYSSTTSARSANLDPRFIAESSQRLVLRWLPDGAGDLYTTFGPDDIFAYLYALLYAPSYRARYADFLKIDFPRLPLPTRVDLFRALCQLGRALSQAHLLEQVLPSTTCWLGSGEHFVEHVRYRDDIYTGGCVFINTSQYLARVPHSVWNLTIGGYKVAKKWLLDRRGRCLTPDELHSYRQIIASLAYTLELMTAIDKALESHGGWPL
ncbi:MAG TPA: type ISP restriction/modification enzyme [Ktedonobacteraceae bacterium]